LKAPLYAHSEKFSIKININVNFLLTKNSALKISHPHSFHINVFMYVDIQTERKGTIALNCHHCHHLWYPHTQFQHSSFVQENKVPIKHIANVIIQCNKSAIAYHYASYKAIMIMIIIIIFTDFMLHLFIFNDHPHADEKRNVWMSLFFLLLLGRVASFQPYPP